MEDMRSVLSGLGGKVVNAFMAGSGFSFQEVNVTSVPGGGIDFQGPGGLSLKVLDDVLVLEGGQGHNIESISLPEKLPLLVQKTEVITFY